MLGFKQFISEEKEADWDAIHKHYETLHPTIQSHIDRWTGVSPHDVKNGHDRGSMQPTI